MAGNRISSGRAVTTIVAGVAAAASVAACSGSGGGGGRGTIAPTTSARTSPTTSAASSTTPAPSPTSAAPDPAAEAAYRAYKAALPLVNDHYNLLIAFGQDAEQGKLAAAQTDASSYRNALFNWDAAVRAITFPAAAQASVNALLDGNRTEIVDLDAVASTTATNLRSAETKAAEDDARGVLQGDKLESALGHPVSAAALTDDEFNVATTRVDYIRAIVTVAEERAIRAHNFPVVLAKDEQVYNTFAILQTTLGKLVVPSSAQASVAALTQATQAVIAFFQRRQTATNLAELNAVGDPSSVIGPWDQARAQAAHDLGAAAGN